MMRRIAEAWANAAADLVLAASRAAGREPCLGPACLRRPVRWWVVTTLPGHRWGYCARHSARSGDRRVVGPMDTAELAAWEVLQS